MPLDFPFRNLVPTFFAGLLDDPLLLIRTRPDGRHLLFDCGMLHHLAKRTFTRLDAIFISHAHMDHWMGIDTIVRQVIAADRTLDLFGGPGLADKFAHKLRGYDWNLTEDYWSRFRVHEIGAAQIDRTLFPGAGRFLPEDLEPLPRQDRIVYRNRYLEVEAACCDHRLPSLIFRINERPGYRIDGERLSRLGLRPGAWLGELKRCVVRERELPARLQALSQKGGAIVETTVEDVPGLLQQLLQPEKQRSIGYISDIGYSEANRETILRMMQGVDLLVSECTFLAGDKERARASWHLCTEDVNALLEALRPGHYLPMHLSRSYSRRAEELYRELRPPPGTAVLQLPLQRTPRPLLASEIDWEVLSAQ